MKTVFIDWNLIPYAEAWQRQTEWFDNIVRAKVQGESYENRIVMCEHPHVYTLGRSGKENNMLLSDEQLKAIDATLYHIDRGGDITYHGPGQLVCYPILNLEEFQLGLKEYVHLLEEAVIRVCASYGIEAGRLEKAQGLVDELLVRADEMCKAERLYREGKLPKRVCHCDTKVNNMMFDEDGKVLCVIDLDTVMPSFVFSDYGDFLRTGANTGDEDDKDLDRVNFNMEIFKAFTKGYLKGAKSFLTPIEIENLPYAAALFPYMQCVRFLADYINGDTYYKIKYPEHNLVRTKAQFKLLQSVEANTPEMIAFINECLKS